MPTATKTITDQLAKLELKRGRLHKKVLEIRDERDEWDRETMLLRAELSTSGLDERRAEELSAEVKSRLAVGNPHQAAYDEALGPFHEADAELEEFKLRHVRDRIADRRPAVADAIETIRRGLELLGKGSVAYLHEADAVQHIVSDSPFGRRPYLNGHDPRPAEWARMTQDALASEIVTPGLTPQGEARFK
jgi:hypothetical protein